MHTKVKESKKMHRPGRGYMEKAADGKKDRIKQMMAGKWAQLRKWASQKNVGVRSPERQSCEGGNEIERESSSALWPDFLTRVSLLINVIKEDNN